MASRPGWFGPDQYTNLANPSAHYRTTGPEVLRQTVGRVTHFVASLGTCGTVTGTGTYLKQHKPELQLVAACPVEGHDIPGVRSKTQAKVTAHFRPELYDELVEITNQEAYEMCLRLNQEASIIAGPSSGLNLVAALKAVPDEPGNCAVVIFCDDIWKYTNSCAKHLPELFGSREPQIPAALKSLEKIMEAAKIGPDSLKGEEVREYLAEANPVVVDVRPAEQFEGGLRATGARSLPLPGIMDEALAEEYDGSLPRDKETPLLLYCNRGIASLTAMMMLKSMGYSHVKHVVDGMFEWWRLSLPTENSGMPLPMAQNDVEKSTVQKYRASLK
eukprot:TRINITY_DN11991_c0_g1_i6.p1 TRINITY_DN11991_c0_g1~~TRINITY_DN11991_c0_g1_i6.p1  ORF type:complete len:331 (+),score=71.94 TRINITY_DN11991_c0_g1_i6:770-1762(+)